jgi:hypothetical protein
MGGKIRLKLLKYPSSNKLIIVFLVIFTAFFISVLCFPYIASITKYKKRDILISRCLLTEDSIIIEINTHNIGLLHIRNVIISYKNIPSRILFLPYEIKEEEWQNKNDSKLTVTLNLENISIFEKKDDLFDEAQETRAIIIDEEAELKIETFRVHIYGTILIKKENVDILDQGFYF